MLGLFHSNRILRFQLMALMGAGRHGSGTTGGRGLHAQLAQVLAASGAGTMPEVRARRPRRMKLRC